MPADSIRRSRDRKKRGTYPTPTETILIMTLKTIFTNKKTSLAGVVNILMAIGGGLLIFSHGDPGAATQVGEAAQNAGGALQDGLQISDAAILLASLKAVVDGIGHLFARDADKTSKQSGAE